MKLRRLRWLLGIGAAMLVAHSVTAAVRACTVDIAGAAHFASQSVGTLDQHVCPEADAATQCLAHCTQSVKSAGQNLTSDAPLLFIVPAQSVYLISSRPEAAPQLPASRPPVVGPSLTILFRKLRN